MKYHESVLAAVLAWMPCIACTAEKTSMKSQEVAQSPSVATVASAEGVFAETESLQPVYFDLNRSTLNDAAKETIQKNAEWLKGQPPFLLRVVGYADARGSAKRNGRLAERRAAHVREAYAALGIPKERILISAHPTEPSDCPGLMEDCLARSRRSDTLIEDKALASR